MKESKQSQIKKILVALAQDNLLPQDMTTLDEHIFDSVCMIEEKDIESKAEQHALGQYLSEYPHDMSYEEILKRLTTGDLEDDKEDLIIVVWEPFDFERLPKIAEYIEDSKSVAMDLLKDLYTVST